MSRQDKAVTERFTRTLRELVKQPENKVCADCKRNDPRWASWNLGVFLCIRCSGIHRGMGTHISKVKSVDLDVWTPEQMESIQKWGNHLANLYWEAHLKPGHIPPEHKMESFIRSKYESKRWAMEGPPPADPSILEGRGTSSPVLQQTSRQHGPSTSQPVVASQSVPSIHQSQANRQPQSHQLLSTNYASTRSHFSESIPSPSTVSKQSAIPKDTSSVTSVNDLFTLDFHAPTSTSSSNDNVTTEPKRNNVKHDILSLFSSSPAAGMASNPQSQFGALPATNASWGINQQYQPPPVSMVGATGTAAWGVGSGWSAPPPMPPVPNNVWGSPPIAPAQQPSGLLNSTDIWNGSATATSGQDLFNPSATSKQKKDDVFGDIWGGFK